jgi:hypothetical protein
MYGLWADDLMEAPTVTHVVDILPGWYVSFPKDNLHYHGAVKTRPSSARACQDSQLHS